MAIPGNKSATLQAGYPLLLGANKMADGYNFAVEAEEDSRVFLLLYKKRAKTPFYELELDDKISDRPCLFRPYPQAECGKSGIQFQNR